MASKAIYTVVAVVGIAVASGAAWWYQNKPRLGAGDSAAATGVADGVGKAPGGKAEGGTRGGDKSPGVEVAKVELVKLVDDAQTVGSLRSRQSVMLRPEVSGRITQLNFSDGERVRKGQLLVQFDDQLPLAQVKQSRAELSIAAANHKRNQDLVAQNFISQRSVDESGANLEVAQAKLALAEATANRLKIIAPFHGMTGIRLVNPGDYLKDGADIVNVEDLDAMFVDFRLPERYQSKLKRGQRTVVDLDALPGRKFTALIQAIDPLIDANGRSVSIRACIDNRQMHLRPGMFARVTAVFGERDQAMTIPEEAILPQGTRAFVIKLVDGPDSDSKVSQRVEVKLGLRRPGRVEITDGLQPSDVVVIAGQQRIQRDGTAVRVIDVARGGAAAAAGGQGNSSGNGPRGTGSAAAPASGASAATTVAAAGKAATGADGKDPAKAPGKAPARTAGQEPGGPNPCVADVADARPTQAPPTGAPWDTPGAQPTRPARLPT